MTRFELAAVSLVVGFICGAAFTLAYMGNPTEAPKPHKVALNA